MNEERYRRTKAYQVIMSKGDPIQIDAEEVEKVFNAVARGAIAKLKRGIINPSYFVSVVEDRKRIEHWHDDIRHTDENHPKRLNGMESLKDIFEDPKVRLPQAQEVKQIA